MKLKIGSKSVAWAQTAAAYDHIICKLWLDLKFQLGTSTEIWKQRLVNILM